MQSTIKQLIYSSLTKYKNNKFLFDRVNDISLSYAETFELTKNVISLNKFGLTKGDFIVSYTPLCLESILVCLAALLNGYVFVPVDHNWTAILLKQVVDECNPKLVITDEERFPIANSIIATEKIIKKENLLSLTDDIIEFDLNSDLNQDDLAVILYTSGSTGTPKGVMLSQRALFNSSKLFSDYYEWSENDVFMNLGDLHSMSGLRNTCLTPLHSGASVIVANDDRSHVLNMIQIIEEQQVGFIGIAPTIIRQLNIMFSQPRKQAIKSLKAIFSTGGMLPTDQLFEFYQKYEIPVLNYYGLTETCGFCAGHHYKTFSANDNCIGFPVGADFVIVPQNNEHQVNNSGELLVKSENLMLGYFKKEKETIEVLKDGYFYTGDIVKKRPDGCIELVGRKKNIIKNINSELIHLEEIEDILEKHPLIKEATTCGYSHFEEDEKIVAFIVFEDSEIKANIEACNDIKKFMVQNVGKNRAPWRYYVENSLPKGSLGKIQWHLLKEKLNGYIQSGYKGYF